MYVVLEECQSLFMGVEKATGILSILIIQKESK